MRGVRGGAVVLLAALVACGDGGSTPPTRAVTPLDRATTGTIAGTVRLEGPPPTMSTLPLATWPGCQEGHAGPVYTGDVLVHGGFVQNAFVYLKEGLGDRVFAIPTAAVEIDQKGCMYVPHVAGAQVGQAIRFLNSDPTMHNVRAAPRAGGGWNFSLGVKGSDRTVRIDTPEVMVEMKCDLHPWMRGYLGVVDHPYFAVTGSDGRFTLEDVPAGDYVVAVWHERFGTREARVSLAAKGAEDVSLTFTPAP